MNICFIIRRFCTDAAIFVTSIIVICVLILLFTGQTGVATVYFFATLLISGWSYVLLPLALYLTKVAPEHFTNPIYCFCESLVFDLLLVAIIDLGPGGGWQKFYGIGIGAVLFTIVLCGKQIRKLMSCRAK